MKYVAAYLLASLGGKDQPSAKDLESILGAGGLDVDMDNANAVVNALKGKSLQEVITAGQSKMASVPSGAPAAAAPAAGAAAPAAAVEEKKVEKKEEKKEESEDEDMGFGLFD